MPLLSFRTRAVLRLLVRQSVVLSGRILVNGALIVALLVYLLGSLSVNIWTYLTLQGIWQTWHTLGVALSPHQRHALMLIVAMTTVVQPVFWGFLLRNVRRYPVPNGPLINNWVLGLPNPTVRRGHSPRHEVVLMFVMTAVYAANMFSLLAVFAAWTFGLLGLVGLAWLADLAVRGWDAFTAPVPVKGRTGGGATIGSTWQRVRSQVAHQWA